ncbi:MULTISPECIES: EAL domain-containing protein [unclassified Clostridium]|uniref:bifunctional diguanylate cyclase/phosphodiesterase n=1 Tax=unclassified Clostridium TaxID=2614128 RepID=UPI000297CCDF|nr:MULTISPECIES: EAL domain-containing protein [unclassified Clostridium]EKQ57174.1 MAG: PAS domain S-box/diguanylate cyclase (GGDEF) domain-containing protein [Clostridium sp. Maddingley MBC34-26]
MRLTFRLKLFLCFVAIILITSAPIALISYNYIYNYLGEELYISTQAQMVQVDNNISNLFKNLKENAKFLATTDDMTKADESISALFNIPNVEVNKKYSKNIPGLESTIYNHFEQYGISHPETTYAYIGTKWGGYIQWPDGLGTSKFDPRKRPWYSLALDNPDEVMITSPYMSAIDDSRQVIVSASTTVKNTDGEIVGVVGIDVSLDRLSKMISTVKAGDTGYIFLYLKDGTIVAHPNTNLNFNNISQLDQLGYKFTEEGAPTKDISNTYKKFINEDSGSFEIAINGAPVIVNVYTSPDTGWKIASIIPKSDLLNKANRVAYIISFICGLALILIIILSHIVTKRIAKPINKLTSLMESAGNGDLSVKADFNTSDEFGKLGNSFNLMIGKLSAGYEELSSVYEELLATEEELRTQYNELQSSEEALKNSEERYKLALECANDSIFQWDFVSGKFYVSDKLTDITGYNLRRTCNLLELITELIHPDDIDRAKDEFYNHIENISSVYNTEYRLKTNDGSYVWILVRGKAIRDLEGRIIKFAGSIRDISDIKKSEDKIKFMAYYDSLTMLPNRTLFMDRLNAQLELAKYKVAQGAVFFIDLDNFKNINDTIGHDYGDKLLMNIAKQFESVADEEDTVCRLGGDEFILLRSNISESEVKSYAKKLLNLFKGNFNIDNKQMYITASIGVALYPKDGTDANTILKNADSAMYKAKEMGKNRYALYDPEMYYKLERKTTVERILRSSIENNELSINYQPQYDAQSREIFGFEALIRLNSKELGFISPLEFIPIAEECGFITELGKWVFSESCKQSVKWLNEGYRFKSISINISSVDLQQPDFLDNVKEILNDTGIDPSIVELEITETVLMQSLDSSIKVLTKLMDMGIRIALDDFGTGYSSLNYLRKIPISTLKIDKSFIDNITSSKKEESIIKNIIQMAHSMNLKVVAEGVEVEEQLLVLKERKCDYIQGYYFSKPLPANELERLLSKEEK